jgi:hypothetical protein
MSPFSLYFDYLIYVLRHKWFVFLECCKLGIPWLGIIHDLSRFYPDEFLAYAASAPYNKDNKPEDIARAFRYAWNDHQHRNKHHFEYWIHFDYHDHSLMALEIPEKYRLEMLADWRGAARAGNYSKGTAKDWYLRNQYAIGLAQETRKWIEEQLGMDDA